MEPTATPASSKTTTRTFSYFGDLPWGLQDEVASFNRMQIFVWAVRIFVGIACRSIVNEDGLKT